MPQDTTFINGDTDIAALPDSVKAILKEIQADKATTSGSKSLDQFYGPFIFLGIFLVAILINVLLRIVKARNIKNEKAKDYESKEVVFDNLLQHYNPYYKSLSPDGRNRFMQRTIAFMELKEFKYIDIEPEDMMPLLISGAAVQLTFGLNKYTLDYFSTIFVVRDNYTYGLYNVPFEGHVSDDGIYLSWSNFMHDNNDYTDGENVGLHELAHALAYVNFTAEQGIDEWFHDKFKSFSEVGRPLFERMQAGETNLLNKYAATNYNEFWAVCVETFFERSEKFKQELPDLYFALCTLLNQDPMTQPKVISYIESN